MNDSSHSELDRLRARVRELEGVVDSQANRLEELVQAEAELRAILDHAPVKIALKDAEGHYLYVNPRAEFENDYRLEEIRGKLPEEIHYSGLAEKIRAHDLRVLSTGEASSEEVEVFRRGRYQTMMNTRFPVRDESGRITGIGIVVMDTTEQRAMERQLKDLTAALEDRVAEGVAELESAQQALIRNERLAAIGELTGTVSHELRNPLGVIVTSMHSLRRRLAPVTPEVELTLARMERASDRCVRIIEELLEFARLRSPRRLPTDIDLWIESVLDDFGIPDSVTLNLRLASGATAFVDRHQLAGALNNAVQNALDAMRSGKEQTCRGTLTIESAKDDEHITLSVSDTGYGIDSEQMKRIFEPLFSTKSFGVGLGLPFIKRVAEEHKGRVDIESTRGEGTRVSMLLPLNGRADDRFKASDDRT